MTNNLPDSKLDEAVKNTLSNYEASSEGADWSRMENMLNAAPQASSFKWSYAVGAFIGLAVIGGGYFLYTTVSSSHQNMIATPPAAPKTEQVITPAPKPVTPAVPVTVSPIIVPETETTTAAPATVTNPPASITPAVSTAAIPAKKTSTPAETAAIKEAKNKKQKTTASAEEEVIIHQRVSGMGNEPVFGDMLDSSRGIIGETREKDETKKAAKAKKDVPVGWDAFMLPNVNTDSLRKYKNQRDSVKYK